MLIYLIQSKADPSLKYVGSTTNDIEKRVSQHKDSFKRWKKGTYGYNYCFEVLKKGDFDVKILQRCRTEKSMMEAEQKWIRKTDCVNKAYNS